MTDDLVTRLRAGGETCGADTCKVKDARSGCLCALAADRIEQLEAALREIAEKTRDAHPMSYLADYFRMARAALEGKDD